MAEKREMTPAVREALKGLTPFSRDKSSDFTPDFFKTETERKGEKGKTIKEPIIPVEFHPVFKIRPFTKDELKAAREILSKVYQNIKAKAEGNSEKYSSEHFSEVDSMARKVCIGWDNYYNSGTEKLMEWEKEEDGGCREMVFELVPSKITTAIFLHSARISGILDLERLGLE
ncbi:MAG: hypothetical protein U9Q21_02590 [Candidatus Auribacterota bacterium]|nr:hypothetical protein [Candidatus Auribacterota bacterium]